MQAGHGGRFGLVVGVDRGVGEQALRDAGANISSPILGSSSDMRATDNPADPLDRLRFPAEEWALTETSFSGEDLGTTETLFAVGNGYLGMRGTPGEGRPAHAHGTFINGFTRPGASATPRTRMGSPPPARPSSTSRTPP